MSFNNINSLLKPYEITYVIILMSLKKCEMLNTTNKINKDSKKIPYKKRYKVIIDIPDCNECVNCLDKPRNGGRGKRKQSCKNKLN